MNAAGEVHSCFISAKEMAEVETLAIHQIAVLDSKVSFPVELLHTRFFFRSLP